MQFATLNKKKAKTNDPIFPSLIYKKDHKQVSVRRLRSISHPSSYHCPVSKRLDCSGWLSDWPQALAGCVGHCERRLGNELKKESQQNTQRLFRETEERQTHWVNWGEEKLVDNRKKKVERS